MLAIQTFGTLIDFHLHLHGLVTGGVACTVLVLNFKPSDQSIIHNAFDAILRGMSVIKV